MTGTIAAIFGTFLVGMLLIAAEAFIIPGFGLPGLLGAIAVVWAAVEAWVELSPVWGLMLGGSALFVSLAFVVWLPKTRVGKRFTLRNVVDGTTNYDADAKRAGIKVGQVGVVDTDLRPSGMTIFGEDRVEVRAEGNEWIERGRSVCVTRFKDGKVFVEPVSNETEDGEE